MLRLPKEQAIKLLPPSISKVRQEIINPNSLQVSIVQSDHPNANKRMSDYEQSIHNGQTEISCKEKSQDYNSDYTYYDEEDESSGSDEVSDDMSDKKPQETWVSHGIRKV